MSADRYLLRDLKTNTELLILAEYLKNPSVKRKDIAERLGVTEQAVSQYVSRLESRGYLSISHKSPRLTRKGVQMLQERFSRLNDEIREILRQVRIIETCVALAGAPINAGQKVGLIMKNGRLVAFPGRRSSSTGIAKVSAEKGEELLVGNLSGVVELNLGNLLALQIPSEISGGSRKIDRDIAINAIKGIRFDEIAAGDLAGEVAALRLSLKPTIVYAPIQASMSALSKGLNVLFIGTRESVDEIVGSAEDLRKKTGYSIRVRVVDIGIVD
ncbi:MAG: winged helix-turn-helix transcriptional regulator [Thermoplasmata archaeon]